ncbi:MAG: DUF4339 domain-containing protein [Lachnospiraceae bacterium]|nr:DUF4339 domain-containing protein [Lachnospiraceae bacterium]
MELRLEQDEYVLIRTGNVAWISDKGQKLDDFVLTNKGLYCIYRIKTGIFGRTEEEMYRFKNSDMIVDEEASHIEQVKIKGERCIQIQFKHGMEHFSFQRVQKATMDAWFTAFRDLLGVPDLTTLQRERNKEVLSNLASDVMDSMGNLLNTGSKAIINKIDQMAETAKAAAQNTGGTRTVQQFIRPESTRQAPPPVKPQAPPQVSYHLAIEGTAKGPYSLGEIRQLAGEGTINRETLAWTRGMVDWQPLEEIEELRCVAENMPPVLK